MDVQLGVIGRGYWGNTYCKVLDGLRIPYWQDGRYWHPRTADGVIVATSSDSHYEVARTALGRRMPVLVEKPVCMDSRDVEELVGLGGIAFAGHTRLYDPTWREFKAKLPKVRSVEAWAGGVNETNPDAVWNWGTHLSAMCFDLGFEPYEAVFHISDEKQPVRFVVNNEFEYRDGPPGALACLVTEFCDAIRAGKPNNEGLKLGLKTVQYVEWMKRELCGLHVA
ncbi:MAG TPA: Gfo/Idh/MocA family oxidoreductase [Pseudolabrys sp.]